MGRRTAQRLAIIGLFLFITGYQLRSSMETIHLARHHDFWVPFSVDTFSDRIENLSPIIVTANSITKTKAFYGRGPLHLVAVNHRPFRGMSVYLTQLWNHHPTIGADPTLQILMRYDNSQPFPEWFAIPHCTCNASALWELIAIFLLPPLFCVLVGFLLVIRRPDALHIWALSALLLAMSQLDLVWHGTSYPLTANTMAWADWFRIPATLYRAFAQSLWPAALVLVVSHLFPITAVAQRWSRRFALLLLAYCLVQCVLAVAWSEYYLPFVRLYQWLQQHHDKLIVVTLASITVICFLQKRGLGAVALALAVLAVWVLPFALVVPAFAAGVVLCTLAFEFRRIPRRLSLSLLLLTPPALYVMGVLNGNFTMGAPWSYLACVLLCAVAGLLGLSAHCVSVQTDPPFQSA